MGVKGMSGSAYPRRRGRCALHYESVAPRPWILIYAFDRGN